MRRRALLAVLGAGMSGCSSIAAPGDNSKHKPLEESTVVEYFGDGIDRPDCQIDERTVTDSGETYDAAGTLPYPDPSDVDEGTPIEYVESFDEAFTTNRILCEVHRDSWVLQAVHELDTHASLDVFDHVEVIALHRWAGAGTGMDKETGGMWAAEIGLSGVLYVLDRTGLARCVENYAPTEGTPDQDALSEKIADGQLVETFG